VVKEQLSRRASRASKDRASLEDRQSQHSLPVLGSARKEFLAPAKQILDYLAPAEARRGTLAALTKAHGGEIRSS
jgi:hypothetical protein